MTSRGASKLLVLTAINVVLGYVVLRGARSRPPDQRLARRAAPGRARLAGGRPEECYGDRREGDASGPSGDVSYVRATLKGMALTFKHMLEPKVTMQYPEEKSRPSRSAAAGPSRPGGAAPTAC